MADLYWGTGGIPSAISNALEEWVNENVVDAINNSWKDGNVIGCAGIKGGRFVIDIFGPEKPMNNDGDIYSTTLDLLEELTEFSKEYAGSGKSDIEDLCYRAISLHKLAADIEALAVNVDVESNKQET